MRQAEYFDLYNRLTRFATGVARRHFHDETQRDEAVFQALNKFVDNSGFEQVGDELIIPPSINDIEAWGKTVIVNAIKDFRRVKQPLEPMPLPYKELSDDTVEGYHGYEVKDV